MGRGVEKGVEAEKEGLQDRERKKKKGRGWVGTQREGGDGGEGGRKAEKGQRER